MQNEELARGDLGTGRKAWSEPTIRRLRASAAEASPGAVIFDGFVEGIGS